MLLHKLTGLLVVGLLLRGLPAAQASDGGMPAGLVLVAEVNGTVTLTSNGTTKPLKVDDAIPAAATVHTHPNAATVLVFSNGTTIRLGSDTAIGLESFLQEPFTATAATRFSEMGDEQSRSITKLRFDRGELVARLKGLRYDRGSSFRVSTPVGGIDVRGTAFRAIVSAAADDRTSFRLEAAAGKILFAPAIDRWAEPPAGGLWLSSGQQIEATLPNFREHLATLPATTRLSMAAVQQITAILEAMHRTTQGAGVSPPP